MNKVSLIGVVIAGLVAGCTGLDLGDGGLANAALISAEFSIPSLLSVSSPKAHPELFSVCKHSGDGILVDGFGESGSIKGVPTQMVYVRGEGYMSSVDFAVVSAHQYVTGEYVMPGYYQYVGNGRHHSKMVRVFQEISHEKAIQVVTKKPDSPKNQ